MAPGQCNISLLLLEVYNAITLGFKALLVGFALCASVSSASARYVNPYQSYTDEAARVLQSDAPSWMTTEQQNYWYHCQGGHEQACAYIKQLLAARDQQLDTIHGAQEQYFNVAWGPACCG